MSRASQACLSCRKQKRKCDKALPTCGLCARMSRACDYTETTGAGAGPGAPTAEDFLALQERLAELENRLRRNGSDADGVVAGSRPPGGSEPLWLPPGSSSRSFPSAVFLDIDAFKWAQLTIPRPAVEIPREVVEVLGRGNAVPDAAGEFFDSVHVWFPFISRKRLGAIMGGGGGGGGENGGGAPQPDVALLSLGMLLVTTREIADGVDARANPWYAAAKRFLSLLEGAGMVSLVCLQAMVLVALYEFGHGIYPAAWMSVGQCARYMDVLGIPSFRESCVVLGTASTWTEVEERRRVWWAVYVLDRAICLGNRRRCMVPEPEDHFVFPVDDEAWNEGDPARSIQHPITTPLDQPQGAFARLCQSAMLASQVLAHRQTALHNYRNNHPQPFDLASVTSLATALNTFNLTVRGQLPKVPPENYFPAAAPPVSTGCATGDGSSTASCSQVYFGYLAPRCVALSGLILLMDAYACPEDLRDGPTPGGLEGATGPRTTDEMTMQAMAVNSLRETAFLVRDVGLELLEAAMLPKAQERVSCLCLDTFYGALATLHWLHKENGNQDVQTALSDVARVIARTGMRWKAADEYMGIIEVFYNSSSSSS
ncbi:hypothetical protein QBC47DRAFT_318542 [Echria macrotheca]|uniref:Zn(2)-C6 fungal-type domain-containing protein n=1 Tax=Echria macrotheca TaxID=438768 RepID=A0AAJ0BFQ9_9PEZI|nr:hypothetical protein QBC47DRAFT_318542 [Echria macrotheca]